MISLPFKIEYRPQIESGEYRVISDVGEPVEIVKWNCRGITPILAVINDGDTDDSCFYKKDGVSLSGSDRLYVLVSDFTCTEFEQALADILMHREYDGTTETEDDLEKGYQPFKEAARQIAPQLLSIAHKEFTKNFPKLKSGWRTVDYPQIINGHLAIGDYLIALSEILRLPKEEEEHQESAPA